MRILSFKRLALCAVTVLSVALATAVRPELDSLLGEDATLLIFAIAVIMALWLGGGWPGALGTALSLLVIDRLFFAPKYSIFSYDGPLDQIRAVSFGMFGALSSLIPARLRGRIEAKRETRKRFRSLVEGVTDYAIFMLDAQGRVASWSPGAERINGYRADEIVGLDFSVFFAPEDIEKGEPQRILEIAAAEGRYEWGGWRTRRDGSRFWASGVIAAIDDRGRLRGFTIIARDATERKVMEERVRFLADLSQALLPLADPEEIVATAARMLGEYLGVDRCAYSEIEADEKYLSVMGEYTRGEIPSIVGQWSIDDFDSDALRMMRANRPYVVNDVNDIGAEPPAGRDHSAYKQAEMRALICVPLSKIGHQVARMVVSQKTPRHWSLWEIELVTKVADRCWESVERARAVRNMRKSEERLRRISEAAQDMIWELDLKTMRWWWDERTSALIGIRPEDAPPGLEGWYDYIHLEDVGRVKARFEKFLRGADHNWFDEYRFRCADGSYIHNFAKGQKFYDESGTPILVAGAMYDITTRVLAEEALRASEERYRLLTEISPDGMVIADAGGIIRLANQSMGRMLGVALEQMIGRGFCEFFPPRCVDQYRGYLANLMISNLPECRVEMLFRRDNGQVLPAEVSAVPFYWQGKPFVQFIIHDISRRQQAEAERERLLKEIETERNHLQQILEQMPIGVAIGEAPSGRVILYNQEGELLLRRQAWLADDYQGYVRYGAMHEDGSPYRPEEYPMYRALISGEVIKGEEIRVRRGDGTESLFSINSAPIHDSEGRRVLAIITFIDITERKRAEEELRASEERLDLAQKAGNTGTFDWDIPANKVVCTEQLRDIYGLPPDGSCGTFENWCKLVYPEDLPAFEASIREAMRKKLPQLQGEFRIVRADTGDVRWIEARSRIFYDAQGAPLRLIGTDMDITERKRAEAEREELFVREQAAREEAEAANRMKDEFLTTVSHELRTPLTSILGWARMLTGGRLTGPQARHALEVIEQSAQSQTRLVEDVLDTSRIITGRLKLDAQPVAIEHVFQAAVDVVRPSAEAKGISLNSVVDESGDVVLGDANRLQQAIWNLLSNAVKFTNEGGRVEARLGRAEGQIEIAVTDTGIGIESGFLPHVFDRFRQADSTSTRTYGGLGIGLAIVRHVVEMHGGGVSASSPGKGQGATFKIRLPLISAARMTQLEVTRVEAPPTPPIEREVSENGLRLDGVRVLLVEDDSVTLDLLKFIFDESGAEVIAATSVDEALDTFERFRPDALVSDLAMPDRDGYDLIREVRSREPERGGNVPAVAVTAYARSEDRMRALAAGFQMHITKPISPDELIAIVASLTGHIHYGSTGVSGGSASNGHLT
jgi:PAS domain S-box-containing protein